MRARIVFLVGALAVAAGAMGVQRTIPAMRSDARLPGRPPVPGEVRGPSAAEFLRSGDGHGPLWESPSDVIDPDDNEGGPR